MSYVVEDIIPDDEQVLTSKWYLLDGKPHVPPENMSAEALKKLADAKEIRHCNTELRGLPSNTWDAAPRTQKITINLPTFSF